MANTIKLKRSNTSGDTPTTAQMDLGEIAVNTYDGKLFIRGNNGSDFVNEITSITQGGGSNADTLDNLDSSQFLRSDADDTATGNINFTGNLTKDNNTVWHNGNQSFYIATNTNTVAGVWKASISEVTAYEDGQLIAFYPNKIDGLWSGTTFEINSLGAKTIKRPDYSSSQITTHYDGSNLIFLRYVSSDDQFIVHADYNSTDDYRIRWSSYVTVNNSAGSGVAVHGYQLLIEGIDGKFYPVTEGGSTGNTNAVSTAEMRVGGTILYYESGTNKNANATTNWGHVYESIASANMEFWNNRDSGWATTYRPIYLVATINSNGNFVLDNTSYTSFLTQDLPTSDDNKYYIRIGWMQNNYDSWRLEVNHPIYVYKDGMVREWGGYASNSDKLDNQTGSYYLDYNNFSNTPNAIDNIVEDITPQLGGTLDANGNSIDMGSNTITDTKVGQWDTAYGWGDHSTQGYLTSYSETDTLDSVTTRGNSTSNAISVGNITTSGTINLPANSTDEAKIYTDINGIVTDLVLEIDDDQQQDRIILRHKHYNLSPLSLDMARFERKNATQATVLLNGDVTVSGNIAVTGTVDSRDVAADGTKLDGIESGATADQSASEILTAIKTVDGSGSGLDADTLDGIQASAFVQSLSDLSITSTATELNILDVSTQSPTDGQALTYSTANGLEWGSVASDSPFVENDQTISTSYTVASGKNAQGIGPITISNGATITVSTGSKLVIT